MYILHPIKPSVNLSFSADPELLEMVLINLVKNAIEATNATDDPQISIKAGIDSHFHPVLNVIDNGPGIEKEIAEKMFIPFFTTKKNGSGIGLSLSRQIVQMHGGQLLVNTQEGNGTTFTVRF